MKFAPELVFKCLPDSSYETDIDRYFSRISEFCVYCLRA